MSHPLGKLCFPFIVCKPHATNQRKHTFPKEQELVIPLFSAFPRMLSLLVKKVHLIWRALAPSSGVQCSSQWESEQRRNPFQVSQHTRRRRCLEDIVLAHSCELRCSWIDSRRRCMCGRRPKGVDEKVPITSKIRELCLFLVCHYYGEEKKGTWNAIYIMTTAFLFQSQYAFCKLQFVLAGGSVPRDFFFDFTPSARFCSHAPFAWVSRPSGAAFSLCCDRLNLFSPLTTWVVFNCSSF